MLVTKSVRCLISLRFASKSRIVRCLSSSVKDVKDESSYYSLFTEATAKVRSSLIDTMASQMTAEEAQKLANHWGFIQDQPDPVSHLAPIDTSPPLVILEEIAPIKEQSAFLKSPYNYFQEMDVDSIQDQHLLHPVFGKFSLSLYHHYHNYDYPICFILTITSRSNTFFSS